MKPTKYIDPTTDYGFKRIFGSVINKDLLIAFLNDLFRGRKIIRDLVYNRNEHVGDASETGSVIFDLTCTADSGEQFVIEVQRTSQLNLKRRMLYYSSKLIADQAPKGGRKNWDYAITGVYIIVLMDGFTMPNEEDSTGFLRDICLCNRETGKIFYEDLGFIYLELINFAKVEADLESDLDRWLFVLRNMSTMDRLPVYLRKPIFEKLFQVAEYSNMNKEERQMYDVSLKRKWDEYSIRQTALIEKERAVEEGLKEGLKKGREEGHKEGHKEGREEGREEGLKKGREEERAKAEAEKRNAARKMLQNGFDVQIISDITGFAIEEIEKLK